MKKIFITALALIIFCLQSLAQGSIKGKLMDTASKSPLGYATITVFKSSDTALITYRLSNPDGEFRVPGLPLNIELRAIISYSGFDAFRKEFILANDALSILGLLS